MNAALLQRVNQEVYRRYPALAGRRPKIQALHTPGAAPSGAPAWLLIYQTQGAAVDQRLITTRLRVVIDPGGKILKISTSR